MTLSRRMRPLLVVTALAVAGAVAAAAPVGTRPSVATIAKALPSLLPPSSGKAYYVALNGRDSNPGTRVRPWRTIQRGFDRLRPGERLIVRRGTYVEDLELRRSGTAAAPVTISGYPGERVVLRARSISGDTYPVRFASGAAFIRLRGFVIEGAKGRSSTNVYFDGNTHDVEVSASEIRFSQDQGLFAERTTRNIHIVRNRIHDNGWGHETGQHQSHGIYIEGRDHLLANNVVYDHPHGFGVQVYPENRGTIIVNNTIVNSGHSAIVVGGHRGVAEITIRNNILAFSSKYGVQTDSSCPTSRVWVDTNLIYGNRSGAVQSGCSSVTTSGGNVLADPRFVDRARHNFQLRKGSPAVDRARADYAPTTDLWGRQRPRGTGYDVGALERR